MAKPKTVARDIQRPFQIEELFFSTTDRAGVIRSGNEVFRRVAAFETVEEMIGKPHNIIRHPDMPRAVFKLFWDYLEAGKPVAAYVKNLATDGAYYWVVALAVPTPDGYLSVRFKPSSEIFAAVKEIYVELLGIEKEYGNQAGVRAEGMQAAGERLIQILSEKGFAGYDEFMQMMLATEMGSRAEKIAHLEMNELDEAEGNFGRSLAHCCHLDKGLESLFKQVGSFLDLIASLETKSQFLAGLASEIHLLSLNSLIAAHHLSDDGKGLAVVADDLARISIQSSEVIGKMDGDVDELIGGLRAAAFGISAAKLQVGMSIAFLQELLKGDAGDEAMVRSEHDLAALAVSFAGSMAAITAVVPTLLRPMNALIAHLRELAGTIRSLSRVHLIGKIEASHLGSATTFQQVFEEVYALLSSGKQELDEFVASIELLEKRLPGFTRDSKRLSEETLATAA